MFMCRPSACSTCTPADHKSDVVRVDVGDIDKENHNLRQRLKIDAAPDKQLEERERERLRRLERQREEEEAFQAALLETRGGFEEWRPPSRQRMAQTLEPLAEDWTLEASEEEACPAEVPCGQEDPTCRVGADAAAPRDEQLLAGFLARHGFTGVNDRQRKNMTSRCPLHVAAKRNDVDMVRVLLEARADLALRNSAGRTAQQVARRLQERRGSHGLVLALLGG